MLAAGSNGPVNLVILASAVVPLLIVIVGAWLFLRAGRRHDRRNAEADERAVELSRRPTP
ncbi:MAG: hypothetical protein ACYDCH_15970 [Gaiellaceae bacterium]